MNSRNTDWAGVNVSNSSADQTATFWFFSAQVSID
jgi:hypothetical protein